MEPLELLKNYYGIEADSSTLPAVSAPVCEKDVSRLNGTYRKHISECRNDGIILKTLLLLFPYVRAHQPLADEQAFHNTLAKNIRQDLLRLYVFCNNSQKTYENINISSRVDSIRLVNNCNWLWNEVMKDYLKTNLPDITSVEQAKSELIRGKSKRGRRPKDARIPLIIWGTYRLLTDLHGFKTPMPNSLCDFLVKLLQILDILPENTEIDKYWIRAELRYIKAKAPNSGFNPAL